MAYLELVVGYCEIITYHVSITSDFLPGRLVIKPEQKQQTEMEWNRNRNRVISKKNFFFQFSPFYWSVMEFENDISRSSDSDFNSSPKRVKRRLFASQCASKKVAIEAEKPVSASYIAN